MTRAAISVVAMAVTTTVMWPAGVTAQRAVTITLSSAAPVGSVWDTELKLMGADWRSLSNGAVRLNVQPANRSGAECAVVPQIRAGARPEAAALTTGMTCLDRAFAVFSVPFLFDSIDEAFAVVDELEPTLAARLQPQGLTLISWGFGGWVHIFSKEKIANLDELKRARLFTSAGDNAAENWYRRNGFSPVPLALTDVITGLMNSSVTALPVPPYVALATEYYGQTEYMLDVPIAPLIGALVVNTRMWNRIPADVRPQLIKAARDMQERLKTSIPKQDRDAVAEMVLRGLNVTAPEAGFREASQPLIASMRGTWVPDDIYDLALKARAAYRQARQR